MTTPAAGGFWASLIGQDANVVVPAAFADLMGGLEGGAVLADLVWWQATHGDWFWRTDALIAARQHVSTYAAKKARDRMAGQGWLEQRMAGQPAKAHYRVDLEAVVAAVAAQQSVVSLRSRPPQMLGAGPGGSGGARLGGSGGAFLKEQPKEEEGKEERKERPAPGGALASGASNPPAPLPDVTPRAMREDQRIFGALCDAHGIEPRALTSAMRGRFNTWVKEWRQARVTADQFDAAVAAWRGTWQGRQAGATPSKAALDMALSQARSNAGGRAKPAPSHAPDTPEALEEHYGWNAPAAGRRT